MDERGLERIDRALLKAIVEKFEGGPVGLSTLAVALGEERDTIEDVYEPYLLQLGFLQRTPRGRIVTKLGLSGDDIASGAAPARPHLVAREALLELGYSVAEAEQALAGTDPEASPEERVRQALRQAA